jgi:hypothetical protein
VVLVVPVASNCTANGAVPLTRVALSAVFTAEEPDGAGVGAGAGEGDGASAGATGAAASAITYAGLPPPPPQAFKVAIEANAHANDLEIRPSRLFIWTLPRFPRP